MSVTAIIVDGSDRPQAGGVVVMPAQRVERGGHRWLAVGIGLLTAVVAIGAVGPDRQRPDPGRQPGRAPMRADLAELVVERSRPAVRAVAVVSPWLEWVDPLTGGTVRAPRDPRAAIPGLGHLGGRPPALPS